MPPWMPRSSPFPPVSACNNCSGSRRGSEPKPNGTSSMSLKSSSLRAIDSRHRSRAPAGTSPTPRQRGGAAAPRMATSAAGSSINPGAGPAPSSQPAPVGQGAVFEPNCDPSAVYMQTVISVTNLSKTYASGLRALKNISLDIRRGEIFALLGPNGAGKTTLIGIICGTVNPSEGSIRVDGHDIVADYRAARSMIGLVPQELTTDAFETVWNTVSFSRGLFGKAADPAHIEKVLRDLSLWARKDSKVMTLSGGMKRRLLIAKALSHEPRILFLDEPTAGVDVELRQDMWKLVRSLQASGVTIILTTHYIDEAEEMAERIGVINKGEIILVEDKAELMRKLGRKQLTLNLEHALERIPPALSAYHLELANHGSELIYTYDERGDRTGMTALLQDLTETGIRFKDLHTTQSSLEDIFVTLVSDRK